jgi:hypothetical protein
VRRGPGEVERRMREKEGRERGMRKGEGKVERGAREMLYGRNFNAVFLLFLFFFLLFAGFPPPLFLLPGALALAQGSFERGLQT